LDVWARQVERLSRICLVWQRNQRVLHTKQGEVWKVGLDNTLKLHADTRAAIKKDQDLMAVAAADAIGKKLAKKAELPEKKVPNTTKLERRSLKAAPEEQDIDLDYDIMYKDDEAWDQYAGEDEEEEEARELRIGMTLSKRMAPSRRNKANRSAGLSTPQASGSRLSTDSTSSPILPGEDESL